MEDPIVPGDKIYTPLWDPGRPEHFAIAGRVDLDGDLRDDRERLRNLIRIGGGVIDAELQPDGSTKGTMTVETRYLVLGPIDGEKTREGYNSMIQTAKQFGADTLMVDKLLDRIGWHESTRLVRFGHDSNIDKVPPADAPDGGFPRLPRDLGSVQETPASALTGSAITRIRTFDPRTVITPERLPNLLEASSVSPVSTVVVASTALRQTIARRRFASR